MTKKQITIQDGQNLFEDLELAGMTMTKIYAPIQSVVHSTEPGDYLLVLEDAFGYTHYWNQDGTYDGWEKSMN